MTKRSSKTKSKAKAKPSGGLAGLVRVARKSKVTVGGGDNNKRSPYEVPYTGEANKGKTFLFRILSLADDPDFLEENGYRSAVDIPLYTANVCWNVEEGPKESPIMLPYNKKNAHGKLVDYTGTPLVDCQQRGAQRDAGMKRVPVAYMGMGEYVGKGKKRKLNLIEDLRDEPVLRWLPLGPGPQTSLWDLNDLQSGEFAWYDEEDEAESLPDYPIALTVTGRTNNYYSMAPYLEAEDRDGLGRCSLEEFYEAFPDFVESASESFETVMRDAEQFGRDYDDIRRLLVLNAGQEGEDEEDEEPANNRKAKKSKTTSKPAAAKSSKSKAKDEDEDDDDDFDPEDDDFDPEDDDFDPEDDEDDADDDDDDEDDEDDEEDEDEEDDDEEEPVARKSKSKRPGSGLTGKARRGR